MQHLASPTIIATLVIEIRTNLALPFALVLVLALCLAFVLAFVLAFPFALALVCLRFILGFVGLVDGIIFVAVRTARAVRTRLSVADVEATKQLLLSGGRSEVILFLTIGEICL